MDGFDGHGGLVDEDADSQGESAQGHEVDGLSAGPQPEHGDEQGERDVDDDDESAACIAQEDEDHEAGEHGTEQGFEEEVVNGTADDGALVHLVADLDVSGHGGLEDAEVLLHEADHGKRGGVGTLGDRDVDGAAPVDQSVAGHGIGAVDDLGDVADQDRGVLARADRDVLEVLDVLDGGVDGDE